MTSVNTNAAALTALRTLQNTNSQLESVQGRISTGLKIGEAKDNAAYWSISTTLKSDNKSLATVKDALGLGSATVDVAYQGLNKAKDVLDEIKSKLTAASGTGVNRDTIQKEITQLQEQLKSIAGSSIFSGENWLSVDSSVAGYDASKQVVASFSRDANGAVSIGTIGIDTSQTALFDKSKANGAGGILDGASSLKDASGRDLAYGGKALTGNTNAGGIEAVENVAGTDAVKAKSVFSGTFTASNIDRNDSITLAYQVDGKASAGDITINASSVTGSGFATSGRISSVDELALAANNALRTANRTDVIAINDGGKLALQRTEAGAARSVQVTKWTGVDANFALGGGSALAKAATLDLIGTTATTNAVVGAVNQVEKLAVSGIATMDATTAISVVIGGGANGHSDTTIIIGAAGTNGTVNLTGKTAGEIGTLIADAINNNAGVNGWVSATTDAAGDVRFSYKDAGTYNAVSASKTAGAGTFTGTQSAQLASGANVKASDYGTLTNGNTVFGDADDAVIITFRDSLVGADTQVKITNADLVSANNNTRTLDTDQDWLDAANAAFRRMGLDSKYALTVPAGGAFKIEAKTAVNGQTIRLASALTIADADTAVQKEMGLSRSTDAVRGTDASTAMATSSSKLPVGGITLDADDKIYMNVAVDGAKTSKLVTIDQATVNSALQTATQGETRMGIYSAAGLSSSDTISVTLQWNGSGSNSYALTGLTERSTAEEFAAKLNQASGFSTYGVASVENGRLVLRTNNVGSAASVEVTSVTNSNPNASSGGLFATTADKSTKGTGANANADAQGKITTASDMARVVKAAMDKAGVAGVLVGTKNDALTFESATAGAKGSISVSDVQGVSGANQISVDTLDISNDSLKGLSSEQVRQVLSSYIDVVNSAINKVTAAASNLGSVASRIDMQKSFVNTLMDTIDKGVGALIDADMSEESTKLQALQVKQQLGVQSLSIANQSAQSVLSLFRG